MISDKLFLIFTIIVILAVSTALLYVSNYEHPLTTTHIVINTNTNFQNTSNEQSKINANTITIKDHMYKLVVKELKNILEEARDIYLNALKRNETWRILIYKPYSNFSRMFILNTTIINETTLSVGHAVYKYIVVHVYDAKSKLNFMPQRIRVSSILVELLLRNKSITYTGIVPYDYLVSYRSKTYRVSFSSIGLVETSYYLTVSADKVSNNIYQVKITVARELGSTTYVNVAWLILVRSDSNVY